MYTCSGRNSTLEGNTVLQGVHKQTKKLSRQRERHGSDKLGSILGEHRNQRLPGKLLRAPEKTETVHGGSVPGLPDRARRELRVGDLWPRSEEDLSGGASSDGLSSSPEVHQLRRTPRLRRGQERCRSTVQRQGQGLGPETHLRASRD